MKIYIVDAFTSRIFSGNQAGVVILEAGEDFPGDTFMQHLAAELKHSETAYVKQRSAQVFQIRYFTPVGEVELCGHATIALFSVLRDEKRIVPGVYTASTLAGELAIQVQADLVWMDMAEPRELYQFTDAESRDLYKAYGLDLTHQPDAFRPKLVSTGLSDIMIPVNSKTELDHAVQDAAAVSRLSEAYDAIGVHLFNVHNKEGVTAYCRNFAPLYGIIEEPATGTANGALTYYLHQYGLIRDAEENVFIQGEAMGKPSIIRSRIFQRDGRCLIRVGGSAVTVLHGTLWDA